MSEWVSEWVRSEVVAGVMMRESNVVVVNRQKMQPLFSWTICLLSPIIANLTRNLLSTCIGRYGLTVIGKSGFANRHNVVSAAATVSLPFFFFLTSHCSGIWGTRPGSCCGAADQSNIFRLRSKSLCRKKIYVCLSTPPMLLGAKQQAWVSY